MSQYSIPKAQQLPRFTSTYLISKRDRLGEKSLLDTKFDFKVPEKTSSDDTLSIDIDSINSIDKPTSEEHDRAQVGLIFGNESKGLTGLSDESLAKVDPHS